MSEQNINIIINLLGGLGLFLFGMDSMASGLQKSVGSKMKSLLGILTKNKLTGVLVGTLVTAVIQSSSATTVMVVGFVNAGIMSLSQSVGIIMGANVGTTVTGWLVSSVEWAAYLNPVRYAPLFVFAGAAMILFAKKEKIRQIGEIFVGFGILFVGMSLMSSAVEPLRTSPLIEGAFVTLGSNPFLAIFAGAAVTAIIQSSSASISILQTLALTGLAPWNAAVYIIMGQNIGTCVTAMLSSIGASRNAKSAAYVHLLFNIGGTIVFSAIAIIYFLYINPEFGFSNINLTEISIVHTVFNLANTLILYPFSGFLILAAEKIASLGKKSDEDDEDVVPIHLDDRILETPSFAIENCLKEIDRLGKMALKNLKLSGEALLLLDEKKINKVLKREKNIDTLQEAINHYMVKLCNKNITEKQNTMLTSLFHTVIDIERIGDHSENIAELAQFRISDNVKFSDMAADELREIMDATCQCVSDSLKALKYMDMSLAREVMSEEDAIDDMESKLRSAHLNRLATGQCHPTSGVIFLDAITNLERVSDHALNIVEVVLEIEDVK